MPLTLTVTEGVLPTGSEKQAFARLSEAMLKWQEEMSRVCGKGEIIIGKQRHGPTGTVELAFEGMYTRFSDLAQDDYIPDRMGG